MAAPPLTVVMPVFNAQPHLDAAIESILAQTFQDFEFAIYDDHSTDGSYERTLEWAARDPRIRVKRGATRLGPSASSAAAAAMATSEFVARMDADDVAYPDRLAAGLEALRAHPEAALAGALVDIIDGQGRITRQAEPDQPAGAHPPFAHPTIMYRRAQFEAAGGYREGTDYREDQDLYRRMAGQGTILVVNRPLLGMRHAGQNTRLRDDPLKVLRRLNPLYDLNGTGRIQPMTFYAVAVLAILVPKRPNLTRLMLRHGSFTPLGEALAVLSILVLAQISPRLARFVVKSSTRLGRTNSGHPAAPGSVYAWRVPAGGSPGSGTTHNVSSPSRGTSSPTGSPLVSVVLPVHNAEPYIESSIRSILAQTFADFELVIGDDGSDDGTLAILERLASEDARIRIVRGASKSGLAGAGNWLVGEAKAALIARMDGDDLAHPDRLLRQYRLMCDRPDCVLTGSVTDGIDWRGKAVHPPNLWRLAFPGVFSPMAHPSVMFRRAAFEQAGGYRDFANNWEDLDLWWRIARLGTILVSTRPLVTYRYSQISTRDRENAARAESILETMYRAADAVEQGRSPNPIDIPPDRALRIHPKIFVARSWVRVWSGERTRLFPDLLRRGRLRFDLPTVQSLGFVAWASVSPRSLRVALRTITRLRNLVAMQMLGNAEFVEWKPLRGK